MIKKQGSCSLTEQEWMRVSGYVSGKVKEYCAKKSLDFDDIANKMGINRRSFSRLWEKTALKGSQRNNRLLSSLEFFLEFSNAIDMDPVRFFTEINIFAKETLAAEVGAGKQSILDSFKSTKEIFDVALGDDFRVFFVEFFNILNSLDKETIRSIFYIIRLDLCKKNQGQQVPDSMKKVLEFLEKGFLNEK